MIIDFKTNISWIWHLRHHKWSGVSEEERRGEILAEDICSGCSLTYLEKTFSVFIFGLPILSEIQGCFSDEKI